jgi:phage terminase large subunit-like protein
MLVGSETPRIWTPPLRPLTPSTTLGFAAIEFAEDVIGIELLPWQKWLLIHALELLPDGSFRFRTVLLLVARQNGKSTILQILALFFMYVRGVDLVIGTAQNLDIAEEVWQGAVDIAEDVPELAGEIEKVNRTNGKKALELRHGERYKVQAANRRGGRGLSGDLVLMDELREHQTWDSWGAVTKTTMARRYAQVWAASNAGDAASVVLAYLRAMAHAELGNPDGLVIPTPPEEVGGEDEGDDSLGIFEWSAPPDADQGDRDGWVQANPSAGYTITDRAIRSAFRTDPEWVFRMEVLCQWELEESVDTWDVISAESWHKRRTAESPIEAPVAFGVEVSEDHGWSTIAAAHRVGDQIVVEVVDARPAAGWVPDRLAELASKYSPCAVVVDPSGPAGALLTDKMIGSVEVVTVTARELDQACGAFYLDVIEDRLSHTGQPVLSVALAAVKKKPAGDAWRWQRKSETDISPLVAVTLARHGFVAHQGMAAEAMVVWA